MSLQDAVNEIMKSGWNAKTDSANDGFDNLKPGTYEVMLDKVNHAAFPSGYECINFSFQVIAGTDAGRKEFVHVNLADKKKTDRRCRISSYLRTSSCCSRLRH